MTHNYKIKPLLSRRDHSWHLNLQRQCLLLIKAPSQVPQLILVTMLIATAQLILIVKIQFTSVIIVLLFNPTTNRRNLLVQICLNLMIFDRNYHLAITMRKSFQTKYRPKCAVFYLVSQLAPRVSWLRIKNVMPSSIRVKENEFFKVFLIPKQIHMYTKQIPIFDLLPSQRRLGILIAERRFANATPWKAYKNVHQLKMMSTQSSTQVHIQNIVCHKQTFQQVRLASHTTCPLILPWAKDSLLHWPVAILSYSRCKNCV